MVVREKRRSSKINIRVPDGLLKRLYERYTMTGAKNFSEFLRDIFKEYVDK